MDKIDCQIIILDKLSTWPIFI